MVCASPRTGSYLLCEGLRNTGIAGNPTEYLSPSFEQYWTPRWKVDGYPAYLQAVLDNGRTPNGAFGMKVHPVQFSYFCHKLNGGPAPGEATRKEMVDRAFPGLKYIWLRRNDKLKQGISYAKALQSRIWWDADKAPAPYDAPRPEALKFDRVLLERCITQMHLEEMRWADYFDANGIEPLVVTYEALVDDVPAAVRQVLGYIDLKLADDFLFPESQFRKQADSTSDDWRRQLKAVSISHPAIEFARRQEQADVPTQPAAPTQTPAPRREIVLDDVLASRRWWKVARPFAHLRADNVFRPDVYQAMVEQYRGWMAKGYFTRDIPGYDVSAMTVTKENAGAFDVFVSRPWHDAMARVLGVDATGELNVTLHHHGVGSLSGTPHNDLNPAFFAEDDRDGEGLVVSAPKRCNYRKGTAPDGVTVTERVRAISLIFYLAGPEQAQIVGGETGLYHAASDPVTAPAVAVGPRNNSLVAFECTPYSYHSFISNTRHERECLVMWWHRPKAEVVRRWGEHTIVGW
jgi:LPS sulfotransferase NodH